MSATPGYQASLDSVALFTDLGRHVLEIKGARAFDALNGLVTNAIDSVPSGQGRYAFLLNPKGRPDAIGAVCGHSREPNKKTHMHKKMKN